ncbi:hypothetical protein [Pantoea stewartii]|uniref:Uncharacterized protein n=1 Tax=Pantoea stewartii subsp. stewartii DC283 TaxID=660596 RepID=H3RDT6_PANSE|nr:hypothetical protein [Pantoea stewartii]ARF49996.1 hypothetical protein DSJ_12010 [Pantoea stewartii subsp. stewartii DC283]EHU00525.1 hypothetical protein CKS_2590 [Pantoea stewartii subsp. stewartii DC283]
MSEVKRHSVTGYGRQAINYNDPEGEFVYYEDYAALQQKMDALVGGFEEAIRHKDRLAVELDAANEKLSRYSMSAGQADQFAAEAKSVRIALGFAEDAQDVAPIDLLEKIAGLRAGAK